MARCQPCRTEEQTPSMSAHCATLAEFHAPRPGRGVLRRVLLVAGMAVAMGLAAAAGYYTGDTGALPELPLEDSKGAPPVGPAPSVMFAVSGGVMAGHPAA